MSDSNEAVEIKDIQIYEATNDAVLYGPKGLLDNYNSKRLQYWIPTGLILHRTKYNVGDIDTIEVPRWFAEKKELLD